MRGLALAVLVLAGCGCTIADRKALVEKTEREQKLERLEGLSAATASLDSRYDCEWNAAMICAELADESTEKLDSSRRKDFAKLGMAHADKAIKLQPERVEGHYYKCMTLGRYLELSYPEPILVADLRDEGERTARIDVEGKFEHAGAHRFLGVFYYMTPETGPWGYGRQDKADEHFTRMLELEPRYPENQYEYGKYQLWADSKEDARDAFKKCLDCLNHPDVSPAVREHLREGATEYLKKLGN